MINNRQQSGRRRGRGGQRPQGSQGRSDQGSRIDNRARGNAAQLLEKYKTLARDAQTQGDRVMTEYYLQFADHYFRVVSETKARFEDNQPRRQRDDNQDFDDDGDDYRADELSDPYDSAPAPQPAQEEREDRNRNRQPRRDGREPGARDPVAREQGGDGYAAEPRGEPRREPRREARPEPRDEPRPEVRPEPVVAAPEARERRPRIERPRRAVPAEANGAEANGNMAEAPEENGIADRLPPAFAPVIAEGEEAPAPRPRVRRPRKPAATEAPVEG